VHWDHPASGAEVLGELGVRKQSQARPLQREVYQRVGEIEKVQRKEALMELVVREGIKVEIVREEMTVDVYKRGWEDCCC
jgi:rubrerythrin